MKIQRFLPLFLALGLGACQQPVAPVAASGLASVPKVEETDSLAVIGELSEAFARLKAEGKLVPWVQLRAQLARTTCVLDLPKGEAMTPLSLPALYRQGREAVMMVSGARKCGDPACHRTHVLPATGYMIAPGVMVTNYHVMAGSHKEEEQRREYPQGAIAADCHGQVYPIVEVLAADQNADTAIVRLGVSDTHAPRHVLVLQPQAPIGESVAIISHPESRLYMLSTGIVTQYFSDAKRQIPHHAMCVSAEYGGGSSGAPVLDMCGRAVGTVCSTHTINATPQETQMIVRHCVPASAILGLIQPASRAGQ